MRFFKQKKRRFMSSNGYTGVAVIFIILFVLLFAGLATSLSLEAWQALDKCILYWIETIVAQPYTSWMIGLTYLGSVPFTTLLVAMVTLAFLYKKKKWEAIVFIAAIAGGGLLNLSLKIFFQRARPDLNPLVEVSGFSFPSGHAMNAIILYGMLALFLVSYVSSLSIKVMVTVFFIILIVLIGISRIYLGVHYPTDVAGGFIIGAAWVLFFSLLYVGGK